jgi:hypothetical protein
MAKTTPRQRKTTGRLMHEYKHGELKSGRSGKAGKVKSRKQAIAIALHEAGASKYQTKSEKTGSRAKSKRKEASGRTGQQEREGKSRVGARGKRESSRAMGGKNATRTTGHKASSSRRADSSATRSRKSTSSRRKSSSSRRKAS